MAQHTVENYTCSCKEDNEVAWYLYVKIDKHMGFVDYDEYRFTPNFCPFCGAVVTPVKEDE